MEPSGAHGPVLQQFFCGGDPCVRQWMADSTTCPHCNTADATTLIVRGLDGLIDLIKNRLSRGRELP